MNKKQRFEHIIRFFSEHHPAAETELHYRTAYELLVAVILSAQCTDKRVNQITTAFFKSYPTENELAEANADEVFEQIKSCSYPNNKTKHLLGMAKMLKDDFNGIVPDNLTDLQKLPGVGRKTANVILSVVYNQAAMAVDTHVFRVANRIGLTTNAKNPLQTEEQLVQFIPNEKIAIAHHWLILHGRYICKARKPLCGKCGISEYCKFFQKENKSRKN
jgi:endonuclease-3